VGVGSGSVVGPGVNVGITGRESQAISIDMKTMKNSDRSAAMRVKPV
jgi:hypothetical protein